MTTEKNTRDTEISEMITNIESSMSNEMPLYQSSVSSEIKNNISNILHIINQETYSYVLNMDHYIRNNIKDASFLKKSLIEKIQANMGD